jgi:hypothetical protein
MAQWSISTTPHRLLLNVGAGGTGPASPASSSSSLSSSLSPCSACCPPSTAGRYAAPSQAWFSTEATLSREEVLEAARDAAVTHHREVKVAAAQRKVLEADVAEERLREIEAAAAHALWPSPGSPSPTPAARAPACVRPSHGKTGLSTAAPTHATGAPRSHMPHSSRHSPSSGWAASPAFESPPAPAKLATKTTPRATATTTSRSSDPARQWEANSQAHERQSPNTTTNRSASRSDVDAVRGEFRRLLSQLRGTNSSPVRSAVSLAEGARRLVCSHCIMCDCDGCRRCVRACLSALSILCAVVVVM